MATPVASRKTPGETRKEQTPRGMTVHLFHSSAPDSVGSGRILQAAENVESHAPALIQSVCLPAGAIGMRGPLRALGTRPLTC